MKTISCICALLFSGPVLADGFLAVLTLCGKPLIVVVEANGEKAILDVSWLSKAPQAAKDKAKTLLEAVPASNWVEVKMDDAAKYHNVGLVCERDRT